MSQLKGQTMSLSRISTVSLRPRTLLLILLLFILSACVGATMATPAASTAAPAVTPGVLTVVDAWARPVPVADGNSAAYMTILNGLDADVTLTGVESSIAGMAQTHETMNHDGVMHMEHAAEGWVIPVGGALVLAPGGKHIMLMDLTGALAEGDEIDLQLTFDNGTVEELVLPVRAME